MPFASNNFKFNDLDVFAYFLIVFRLYFLFLYLHRGTEN